MVLVARSSISYVGAEAAGYATRFVAGFASLALLAPVVLVTLIGGFGTAATPTEVVRVVMGFVPVSFAAGMSLEGFRRGQAVTGVVARLSSAPAPGELERLIADALDDPTLEIVYWHAETSRYVNSGGQPVVLPPAGAERATALVKLGGEPVAAIVYDAALAAHPDAIQTVANAAVLALENEQLQAKLRSTINELSQSEGRFRELLERTPVLAVIVDLDDRIVFANHALETVAGVSQPDLIGRRWADVFGDFEEDRLAWADIVAGASVPTYEGRVRDGDGAERVIAWANAPITGPGGELRHLASLGQDITARRQAEDAMQHAQRERLELLSELLRAEEAERGRIAEALHDDTIQALTACLYTLDRLAASDRSADRITQARDVLAHATERARRLMFQLRPPRLEESGPRPIEDLCFRTVREAALNTHRHAQASSLRVTITEHDGELTGEIQDDGIGFDPDAPTNRRYANLHLGLVAMSDRVRLAQGTLTVTSSPGSGTRVSFRVPIDTPAR